MMDHDVHDDRVAQTLEAIRTGGMHLVVMARRRTSEALDALDAGDFRSATNKFQEASAALAPLANAQSYIAIADGSVMKHARELEAGMVLTDVGEVTHVEVTECAAERCRGHVKVKIGEHEMDFGGDSELYVKQSSEE